MNKAPVAFVKYPLSTVMIFNSVALLNYAIGIYLFYLASALFSLLYIFYVLAVEINVYREGCVSCWYYGKRCAMGRGVIAPLFFKKQDSKRFCEKQVTWKNLLPGMLTTVFPIIVGVYLLLQSFNWLVLILMAVPVLTWVVGNPIIYGRLACPHCKQGRICCPANDFFSKK